LEGAGISTADWGRGKAKTIRHLAQEIECGECKLLNFEGTLTRIVIVAGADIFYAPPNGQRYQLIEEKQVFADGRERRRNLAQAVSEKLRPDEDPREAMIRGLREELGISGDVVISYQGESTRTLPSPSYPGLASRYTNHKFTVVLQESQFNPGGYIEAQSDKSTYFVWQPVPKKSD
jgi:hypothetical protein